MAPFNDCADADEKVQRELMRKVFPNQTEVVMEQEWMGRLNE